MAEMDLDTMISSIPSLIEQLVKALNDLESHENFSIDKDLLKDIEGHFRNLEASVVNKSLELDVREKAFKQQESDAHHLIASRDADIAAREQNIWDHLQELKNAAVFVIAAARGDHQVASPEHTNVEDSKDIEVSGSLGETNALHSGSEVKSSDRAAENADGASGKVKPRPELTQLCEQMDAKGLLHYIMESKNNMSSISEELSVALDGATEPGRLVLASLEFFYSNDESNSNGEESRNAIHSLRQACLVCMEAIATLLAKAKPGADHLLYPEIKQQAKVIADEWKPKLATAGTDAANQASLETEAFLQLLATFRIASEFDEEELCKLVLAVAHNRQGPELCRSLGLAHKMPGVIEALIHSEKQIDAARLIHSFELTERFPLVPLLKGYLKDLRRNAQGKGGNSGNAEELTAIKAIVRCIRNYKLEAEYPLDPLLRRVSQLEKAISSDRDRPNDKKRHSGSGRHQQFKRPRVTGAPHGPIRHPNVLSIQPPSVLIERAAAINPSRQVPSVLVERAPYAGLPDKYGYLSTSYDYPPPGQATYPQQTYEQRSYYYPTDEGTAADSYAAAPLPSSYASYAGSALPTADERINASSYAATLPSSYGNYAGSGQYSREDTCKTSMQQRKMASLFHLPSSLAFPNINHSPFSSNSIKASHSHFRISIRNENLPPILSKISEFSSKTLNFLLSGSLALALSLTGVGVAEGKVGVNKPELLPKEFTPVIDVAGFLSDGQEKRLAQEITDIEKDTGFKLRVLAQNYPDTPGLAIKDFWQVDDRTIVFVADPTFGNILNFNVGVTVDLDIPRSFWSRLAGTYGNMFYWKEKGEDASIEAAVMAISSCLREPVGPNNCSEIK